MTGATPRHDPQIAAILFEYFASENMKWASSQEALEGSLGEEALAMGDLLLHAEEPLTLSEIRDQLDFSKSDIDRAYRRLRLFMPTSGPLVFSAISDPRK